MKRLLFVLMAGALCAMVSWSCRHTSSEPEATCTPLNGVLVNLPGIDVSIRDPQGRATALGATVVVRKTDGTFVDSVFNQSGDSLHVLAGNRQTGTFSVDVSKPAYRDTIVRNVVVRPGSYCDTIVEAEVPVTLQLSPGAAPIRSLHVAPIDFLWKPGMHARVAAVVDADADVPRDVSWHLSDSLLANVDANGVVTSKCSRTGGKALLVATLDADTTIRASQRFEVAAAERCP